MAVNQISVFYEKTPGRLAHFTRVLGDNNLDLISLSVVDGGPLGIMRGIVVDYERAMNVLKENGYTVKLTEVLAISVADRPGGMADVLDLLAAHHITVEYLYSFVRNAGGQSLIIFRVNPLAEAEKVLEEAGVKLVSHSELIAL
ncbi:MAG: ACT domain-containing protein [Clostridia bacterium]|nr:ACT domain-containing protein [Clostridia bacterium]